MVDRNRGFLRYVLLGMVMTTVCSIALGASPSIRLAKNESASKSTKDDDLKLAQAETLVLPLVEEHLKELRPLLAKLKEKQPEQYRSAVLELSKTAKRVQAARDRSPETYSIEVEHLQASTQVNLSVARLRVKDSADERQKLRTAAKRLVAAEQSRLNMLAEQADVRVEKAVLLQKQAKQRAEEKSVRTEDDVDQLVRTMLRRAGLDTKKAK